MGQKEVKLPTTATGWAARLSRIVKIVHDAHGLDRFPIKVADVARDFTANVYPKEPITLVEGRALNMTFEGALIPKPGSSGEWGIFFNSSIVSKGRINFTLAHELGHYLLHRKLSSDPIICEKRDFWTWNSDYGRIEAEANKFASFLLMPLDDFRLQINGFHKPGVQDFDKLKDRYAVSVTAAILKWLEITSKRAMIVISRDGFIDWSWSSENLLKTGVFFRAKQVTTPLPDQSLAAKQDTSAEALTGKMLPEGVWVQNEPVFESVLHSEYHSMTISLLIFPDDGPGRPHWKLDSKDETDTLLEDTFSQMQRRSC
jgi:hypothetical protein